MQTNNTHTQDIQYPKTLGEKLAARHVDSAIAAPSRRDFSHASDDFVARLSAGAKIFLDQLQVPAPNASPCPTPAVPPYLAEELFAFADYALLTELQQPALEAMMRIMTIPSALRLLLACYNTHKEHDRGYTDLKLRCQGYLAVHFYAMTQAPEYWRLEPHHKAKVDRALARHVVFTWQGGTRIELQPLQDATLHHIDQGFFREAYLDKPHVVAWLVNDASVAAWRALVEAHGCSMRRFMLQQRASVFRQAARAGRADLVDFVWQTIPHHKRDALWTACEHGALRYAVAANDPAMVSSLLERLSPLECAEVARNTGVWNEAVLSAQSGMISILRQWLPSDFLGQYEALEILVECDDDAAIADFLCLHPDQRKFLSANEGELFRLACGGGQPGAVRVLLGLCIHHIDMLPLLLHHGLLAACKNPMDAPEFNAIVAALEDAALPYGWDLFADFAHRPLAHACQHGHTQVVKHVLGRMDVSGQRTYLQRQGDVMGRQRSLLAAACSTAKRAVVDLLLDCADAVGGKPALVLAHAGAALSCATQSGDAHLLRQLIEIAAQDTEAWASWMTDANVQGVLRRAAASNQVDVLQTWLAAIPHTRQRAALRDGQVIWGALQTGSGATLNALFDGAAGDAALTAAFMDEALVGENLPPLALALQAGSTEAADAILDRVASEAQRTRALTTCFKYLCQTDLPYFLNRWNRFTPQQREALLTPQFFAHLPLQAGAEVATFLAQQHTAAFSDALVPLTGEVFNEREWAAAQALMDAVPAALQSRLFQAWGTTLVRTAIDERSCDIWDFTRRGLGRDATLRLLNARNNELFMVAHGGVRAAMTSFVVLSGQCLDEPRRFGELRSLAFAEMIRKDNVTLLRELLARYPGARKIPSLQQMLHPRHGLSAASNPQITALLLDTTAS